MTDTSLGPHAWWLASRASGLVALGLVTISAVLALAVASRLVRKPGLSAFHRQTAVLAIIFMAVHGLTLLGDPWLHPAPVQIGVPFLLPYRPLWTGLGIIAGYLAAVFGLSFYVRRRIGPRLWRSVHPLVIVAYVLALAHTLGAGTDGSTVWLRAWIALTAPMILALLVIRIRTSVRRSSPALRSSAGSGPGVRPGA